MRAARVAALTVVCAASAVRGDEPPLASRVEALVAAVQSEGAAPRKKALDALRALGPEALPHVLRNLGPDVASPQFDAGVAALVAIDPDQALAAVQTCRTEWAGLGLLTVDRARKGRRVLEELEDRLIAARKAEWSRPVRLLPDELDSGFRVPPSAEEAVGDVLPSRFAWADVPVRKKGAAIEIDATLDGKFAVRLDGSRAAVVAVGTGAVARRVLVHPKLRRWYAASPSIVRGNAAAGLPVEVLDVEGDGNFAGADDLVRFGDGAFRPIGDTPFAVTPQGLLRFRLRREAEGTTISVLAEPEPWWLTGDSRAAMDAWNAWRAAAGLAPHRADRRRSAASRLHHDYWARNGFSAHDEDSARPGWTEEGARAGASASCWADAGGAEFVRRIGGSVLHRSSLVGEASEGVGVFGGPSGCLAWGASFEESAHEHPILVPGPGQTNVPLAIEPEEPRPSMDAAFYNAPHGHPVSATWTRLADPSATGRKLELFAHGSGAAAASAPPAAVPGVTFSLERPYNDGFRAGWPDSSVIFVADSPLASGTLFTARLSVRLPDGPAERVWQFRTR